MGKTAFSPALTRQMVWLAGMLPYQQAAEVFKRIGKRQLCPTSIWEHVKRHGARLTDYVEHQQELVSVERTVLPAARDDHEQRKGVSMDGGMVHIRDEGWKEMKVGAVYDIGMTAKRDPESGEWAAFACANNTSLTAVLGSVEPFSKALWASAVKADIPQAIESCVTADGAPWIWNLTADLFPDSTQVVDWYHAVEHLAKASHALHPDSNDKAKRWLKQRKDDLFQGDIHHITRPLDAAGYSDEARYFHTHKRRMQYHQFQDEGFLIGSGVVESGIKQFKQRLTGPGMRWSRQGAERMLVIRAAVLDNSFDALWSAA